ncbi:MAG TPA: hypothetical protein VJZ32_05590 [Candidatus Bathyarchaeia archaeon]|nr:hypothetical protein [Candidatus Bathyarchaeia archaeon]
MRIDDEDRKKAVIRALADDQSRLILISTMLTSKSVLDIAREQSIPIISAYRKVKKLKKFRLLKVDHIVLTEWGKKIELLRSAIRSASVQFERRKLDVEVTTNVEADEKLLKRFITLKERRERKG